MSVRALEQQWMDVPLQLVFQITSVNPITCEECLSPTSERTERDSLRSVEEVSLGDWQKYMVILFDEMRSEKVYGMLQKLRHHLIIVAISFV